VNRSEVYNITSEKILHEANNYIVYMGLWPGTLK